MTNEEYIQLTRRPSRMESRNIENPLEAFDEYFRSFSLEDCRNHLWELYERCVMCYASQQTVHDDAATILFFYTHTEMLVEAAWLINNKQLRKKNPAETRIAESE
jgi:hypothetical protein